MRMRPDGLIVAQPKRAISPVTGRSFVVFLVAFMAFKSIVMAGLGAEEYNSRVDQLSQGNVIEVFGSLAMYPDPVSRLFATQIEPLFH